MKQWIKTKKDIPPTVRETVPESAISEECENLIEEQLLQFVDPDWADSAILWDFPWIRNWERAGKSGGWLILDSKDEGLCSQEHELEKLNKLDAVTKRKIQDVACDLIFIYKKIRHALKEVEQWLETTEPWEYLVKNY